MNLKMKFRRLSPDTRLYHLDVPVIGLTGGIATGKTTVAGMLKNQGFAIINADHLVKDIYALPETLEFLKLQHPEVVNKETINFRTLREKVFTSQEVKVQIENFIYQRLPDAFKRAYHKLKAPELIIYDVPLLFEKKLEHLVDVNVLVYAPRKIQRARLMNRDGILEDLAESILDQQMDIEDKKLKAQFIIDNSQTETELAEEIKQFLRQILE